MEYTTYYRTKEDGTSYEIKGFTRSGCGVSTHFYEIPKEEYERLSAMSYGEVDNEVKSKLPESIKWGYGYYGHELFKDEEAGLYFLGKKIGNPCD